jgi:subtilase family serine protease
VFSTALIGLTAASANAAAGAQDLGPSDAADVVTASIVLKVNNLDALEALVALSQTPGLPLYHRFLSTGEFADLFAPSRNDIQKITAYLASFGIQVNEVYADRLLIRATGTTDAFNRAFDVDMHTMATNGQRWHRPNHAAKIPLLLRDLLVAIEGLDEETGKHKSSYLDGNHSPLAKVQPRPATSALLLPADGVIATGVPGFFTVGDVANLYNINPLYDAGIDGTGHTIGIATLANFLPDDAFTYWQDINLPVAPDRITQVHVDGGGPLSGPGGSGETSLDVEQSGGLAPGAKIIVYDAPNTAGGFVDMFYRAISDNLVDTLSTSWGQSEELCFPALAGQDNTGNLRALHQVFLEAAIQGISTFAAAGDSGAFDINNGFNSPFHNVLTVDYPASDPAITAAGGTTVPFTFNAGPGTPDLVIPTEQVWGFDYLQNYFVQFVDPSFQNAFFPTGGGGGVSVFWPRPFYQDFVPGIQRTQPGQRVIADPGDGSPAQDLLDLPANFAGRNVPDVSLNADPETGYFVQSTEDGGLAGLGGGTSFVAPQLAGISALLGAAVHGRLGLLNPALYRYRATFGYGPHSPLRDITAGDDWFYAGVPGYDDGAGLGALDVANLWKAIERDNRARF